MKNSNAMKTVLFDLDGTLLNTLDDLHDGVNATLTEMGLPLRSPDQVRAALGNGAAHLLRESLPDGEKDRLEEALSVFAKHYPPQGPGKTALYPGIRDLLNRLEREGWQIAVISNKPDRAVKPLQKTFFPRVKLAVGEREGVRRKPWPDGVLAAMAELGSDPQKTVYVGDSEVDLETAQNAGIPCILVTWGFRDRSYLEEIGGTVFADNAGQLYDLLSVL